MKKPTLKHIISDGSWLLIDRGLKILVAIFLNAWIAREIGPAQYGKLAYGLSSLLILQTIVSFGFDGPTVLELSRRPERKNEVLSNVFVTRFTIALIFGVMLIAYAQYAIDSHPDETIAIIVAISVLIFPLETVDLWFQANNKNKNTVISKNVSVMALSIVKIYFISNECSLITLAILVSIEFATASLVLYSVYKFTERDTNFQPNIRTAIHQIKEALPYAISGLAIAAYMRLDHFLIIKYLDSTQLGYYSALTPIVTAFGTLAVVLNTIISPRLARLSVNSIEYCRRITIIFRAYLFIGLASSFTIYISSSFIITTLYGDTYATCIEILKIYALIALPMFLGSANQMLIVMERNGVLALIKTTLGATTSFLLGVILIPRYGLSGAAISALISQLIAAILINAVINKNVFLAQLGFQYRIKGQPPKKDIYQ
ncbi:MAG: flippase [Limnobacter sp.]|uniref:flippase n=1 Tax=Limnobacter sp. TaxID=2003368 RepID=UPI00391A3BF3